MSRVYLDTSAAGKLLVDEHESAALVDWLEEHEPELVGTHLVETELRRLAWRCGGPQANVTEILARVDVYDMPPSLYREAGLLPGETLRSLDALHLAASVRLDVDSILTYDVRLTEAAASMGIQVEAPAP